MGLLATTLWPIIAETLRPITCLNLPLQHYAFSLSASRFPRLARVFDICKVLTIPPPEEPACPHAGADGNRALSTL